MGVFVGRTAIKDGKGVMVDYRYEDGAKFQPADSIVKNLRPDAP
jgi:branched-chain amino acid transport system substrate-binding protein